jgi:hypothetical protein
MLVLMAGVGLILWAFFGMFMFTGDMAAHAGMFPFGSPMFWFINYITCGVLMWCLVAWEFPPLLSLLTGSWVTIIWSWSALARMTAVATLQTGNATSIVYIIVGLMVIHRSARR